LSVVFSAPGNSLRRSHMHINLEEVVLILAAIALLLYIVRR